MPGMRANDRDLDEGLREHVNTYGPPGVYGLDWRLEDLDEDAFEEAVGDEIDVDEDLDRAIEAAAEDMAAKREVR